MSNRKNYPITASMVDEFRKVFGSGVTVKKTSEKPLLIVLSGGTIKH